MSDRTAPAARNQERSLEAFLAEKARFSDHFGADPDAVLWGAHASLQHWNSLLARVTDSYLKRGEWAE